MRVLVCGDRNWDDGYVIGWVLEGLYQDSVNDFSYPLVVIDGCAKGADTFAGEWYNRPNGPHRDHVVHDRFPADWNYYGKSAGPIRNQQMLDEGDPEVVFAFHDNIGESTGTADMVRRAKKAGIPAYVVSHA